MKSNQNTNKQHIIACETRKKAFTSRYMSLDFEWKQ